MKKSVLLPVRSVLFLLIFIVGAAVVGKQVSEISSWWSIAATAVNILTILLLLVYASRRGQTYLEMVNLRRGTPKKELIIMVVISLAVASGGMNLAGLIVPETNFALVGMGR